MSLKALHICFILLATALSLGFGFWAVRNFSHTANPTNLALGVISFLGTGALVIYLFWFIRKMKKVGSA